MLKKNIENRGSTGFRIVFVESRIQEKEMMKIEVIKDDILLSKMDEKSRGSKETVLEVLKKSGWQLQHASEELKADKELVFEAVKNCAYAIKYADAVLMNEKEFLLQALKINEKVVRYIEKKWFAYREFIIGLAKLKKLSKEEYLPYLNDKEVMILAVAKNDSIYKEIGKELQNDREIAMTAITNYPYIYKDISKKFGKDKEILKIAIRGMKSNFLGEYVFKYMNDEFKNDMEIVELATSLGANILEFASEELRGNRNIVKLAVNNGGWQLKYVSEELRNDSEIIKIAVSGYYGDGLKYINIEKINDLEIMKLAIKNSSSEFFPSLFNILSDELKRNKEILEIVKNDYFKSSFFKKEKYLLEEESFSLRNLGLDLRSKRETVIQAVSNNGNELQFASEEIKNDKEVVKIAVSDYGKSLSYASEEMKNDREVVKIAVSNYGESLEYASEEMKNDKEVVKNCIDIFCEIHKLNNINEVIDYSMRNTIFKEEKDAEIILSILGKDKKLSSVIEKCYLQLKYDLIDEYAFKQIENVISIEEAGNIIRRLNKTKYLNDDKELMIEFIKYSTEVFPYLSKKSKNDEDILLALLDSEDKDLVFTAIKKSGKRDREYYKMIRNFISNAKFNPNLKNNVGQTPLMVAVQANNHSVIIDLLKNPNIDLYINSTHKTPKSVFDYLEKADEETKNIVYLHEFKNKNREILEKLKIDEDLIGTVTKMNMPWKDNRKNLEMLIEEVK